MDNLLVVAGALLVITDYVIKFLAIGVLPSNRKPSSAMAWLILILIVPLAGFVIFLFVFALVVFYFPEGGGYFLERPNFEPANPMLDMHHEIAGRDTGKLGDEIARPLRFPGSPDQPQAENVLLGNDRQIRCFKPVFQRQNDAADDVLRLPQYDVPCQPRRDRFDAMIGEYCLKPFGGALRP